MSTTTKPKTRKAKKSVFADTPKKLDGGDDADEWMDDGKGINDDVKSDLDALCARAREAPEHDWGEVKRPWMRKLLNALAFRPVIAFACRSVRVSDESVRLWRQKDEAFDRAVNRAMELGWDAVEEAAHRRAVDGVPKAIFGKNDQVIGIEMKYSDTLVDLLLRGNRPERYRDKSKVDVTHGISRELSDIIRGVRMRRQGGEPVRNLPAP